MIVLVGQDPLGGADHRLGGRAARRRAQRGLDHRAALLCATCYVALGWVAVLCLPQLSAELPIDAADPDGRRRRAVHGGAVIFALGRPNPWPRVFGFHEIFHVFVILAAVAHFVAMAGWIVHVG